MSKMITTEVRLPKQTIDEVMAIAKLAGLSPESVIKLALATEVRRWKKVGADGTTTEPPNALGQEPCAAVCARSPAPLG